MRSDWVMTLYLGGFVAILFNAFRMTALWSDVLAPIQVAHASFLADGNADTWDRRAGSSPLAFHDRIRKAFS